MEKQFRGPLEGTSTHGIAVSHKIRIVDVTHVLVVAFHGAKIAPLPDRLEDQAWEQKMFCFSRVAMTNSGQRSHLSTCAAVCVLLAAKGRAQSIRSQDVT